ncbi:MAG: hypothetical protein B6229_04480 [Spirochaetaceae bacterium 4572_7]|nr:MAG: hypothetical protein B6229_04480 [Spirochaetaceae bacterium 4572_7]
MFFLGFEVILYVLNSPSSSISIQAFLSHSSKESNGLFPMAQPQVHTNFTSPYFNNPNGIKRIEALILVALGDVRSK